MGAGASAIRQTPNLTIPVPPGTAVSVGYTLRYDDLFKVLFQDAAARGVTDYVIKRTSGNALSLNIGVIGSDRRKSTNYPNAPFQLFDPNRANMADPNLLLDYKAQKTVAYTTGQGQGTAQQLLKVVADDALSSPFNRIEYVENASSVAKGDSTGLLTTARTGLKKNAFVQTFTMKVMGTLPGAVYNSDFYLGDLVTVQYDDYIADLRMTGVEIFVSQAGEVITPTISPI
jgi:hypothetical protein